VQTLELQRYYQRGGWSVVSEYANVGILGTKVKRPELDRLITDPRRRRFDVVLCWKFDRVLAPYRIFSER